MEEWICYRCLALRFKTVRAAYVTGPGGTRICVRCLKQLREEAAEKLKSMLSPEARLDWARGLRQLAEVAPRPCEVCRRRFAWIGRPNRRVCSDECARERHNRTRRIRHEEKRPCACCRRSFVPTRADQLYHSAACRQRAYRNRQREAAS